MGLLITMSGSPLYNYKGCDTVENNVILEMKDIDKIFPGVKALDKAQLTVKKEQYMP